MMMMIVDLYSALRRAPPLRYVSWCIVERNLIEQIRCWAMDHGDDQAAGSRPSDLPWILPDVRTYCNDECYCFFCFLYTAEWHWPLGHSLPPNSAMWLQTLRPSQQLGPRVMLLLSTSIVTIQYYSVWQLILPFHRGFCDTSHHVIYTLCSKKVTPKFKSL